MKTCVAALSAIFLSSLLVIADEVKRTFITTDGQKFENVTIASVEATGITINTDSGVARVPYSVLSPEMQKEFNYKSPAQRAKEQATAGNSASDKAKLVAFLAQPPSQDLANTFYKMPVAQLVAMLGNPVTTSTGSDDEGEYTNMIYTPDTLFKISKIDNCVSTGLVHGKLIVKPQTEGRRLYDAARAEYFERLKASAEAAKKKP